MLTGVESGLVLTQEFQDALSRLERGDHLFLTGKAGTGKSTLVRQFLATTNRNVVVAAPTGIAALNVEGYTIHRLFSFRQGTTAEYVRSSDYYPGRFAKTLKKLDTLIIDEASMVRADLFDCLAIALEQFGPRPGKRFGGVQLVLVGDLYQLPPVVTDGEREHFGTRYDSPYFFSADHYDTHAFPMVELTTVFRQVGDTRLVEILNAVREGALLEDDRAELNTRTDPSFRPPLEQFWLTLTTTNRMATARNREMLEQIDEPSTRHPGQTVGELDGFDLPAEKELVFKTGAQIMMLTNDPQDRWVNGTLARVAGHRVKDGEQRVTVELPRGETVEIGPYTWEVTRPVVEAGALRHEVVGTYTQLPFRLAWAITIHKSQGQTLERVVVDLSGGTFADGQLYVALSRCTSLDGLVLRRDVAPKDLMVDQRIRRFLRSKGTQTTSLGTAYLGLCTVGDEGDRWRPRPAEIALVTDDGIELTTLVNPTRDMGEARSQYGITAGDVQLAPLLTEAWAALAPHLSGRTPVGVNIDRGLGYLDFELKRNGYVVQMPIGTNIDENRLDARDRKRLEAPTALERAHAVRDIAAKLKPSDAFADVFPNPTSHTGYLMPRPNGRTTFLVGGQMPPSSTPGEVLAQKLQAASRRARLDPQAQDLARAVSATTGTPVLDETYTEDGRHDIEQVMVAGARVCFTGSVRDGRGRILSREDLKELATGRGLKPVDTVTKTKCEVLISAEAGSQSGKAQKATQWGKPVFTAEEFMAWAEGKKPNTSSEAEKRSLPEVEITHVLGSPAGPTPVTPSHRPKRLLRARTTTPATRTTLKPTRAFSQPTTPSVPPMPEKPTIQPVAPPQAEPARNMEPVPAPVQAPLPEAPKAQKPAALPEAGPSPVTAPFQAPVTVPVPKQWAPPSGPGTHNESSRSPRPMESAPTSPKAPAPTQYTRGGGAPMSPHPQTVAHRQPYPPAPNPPAQMPTLKKPSEGQQKFHLIMGAVFLFLTVGMFIFAVIGAIILPDSVIWVAPVALAWLAALIQIPVWIIWSIKRNRRQRR
ncbi:AAA family ATPase [Kocuria oceani]|uniref:AAA family ATPase n=1 Tax=Kocuria oceani TaxID=988827 RepID=A0ABV9TNT8_9MICC|nr:AAA family ATPase [Kocuria oceani]